MFLEPFELSSGIYMQQASDIEKTASVHVPVLLDEVVEQIAARKGGVYLDCTLGGAGHTEAILSAHPENRVVALDRDARALHRAKMKLARFSDRVRLVKSAFAECADAVAGQKFDGVLADLGLSSDQLDENRGFSFNDSAALDMRMDESGDLTAADIVNAYSESELFKMFKRGGVGNEAFALSKAIVRERPFTSVASLSALIAGTGRSQRKQKGIHPATLPFQALRIEVNAEFEQLDALLASTPNLVCPGARALIISFHSLEDGVVTKTMRTWEGRAEYSALWPESMKQQSEKVSLGKLLSKKAIVATEEELQRNPRARSARLRVFEFNR